jgi:release factor glutamine methyltransferase
MNISEALQASRQRLGKMYDTGESNVIAELLLGHILQKDRLALRWQAAELLSLQQEKAWESAISELEKGRPIQYVLHTAPFFGLDFYVDESVLIPRPETEELVVWALQYIGNQKLKVLEVGTGSACIAVALKKNAPQIEMYSIDIAADALAVASRNAAANSVNIHFERCNFLDKANWQQLPEFDVIISNPPYILPIEASGMAHHVLAHEPETALFVTNEDPQQFYKAILAFAHSKGEYVKAVFLELNQQFAQETERIYKGAGWETILRKDINDNWRMLQAVR